MQVNFFSNQEDLSLAVAKTLLARIPEDKRVNILLSSGSLPVQIFEHLAPKLKAIHFNAVHYYAADEIPIHVGDVSMYAYAKLRDRFFIPAEIPADRTHALTNSNINTIDEQIEQDGGIDIAVLSLESDGHIAANLIGSSFDSPSREVKVDKDNQDVVNSLQDRIGKDLVVPDTVLTIGMKTIKKAKHVILIATGEKRANAMFYLMKAPLSESLPASILHLHNSCQLMIDAAAAKGVHG